MRPFLAATLGFLCIAATQYGPPVAVDGNKNTIVVGSADGGPVAVSGTISGGTINAAIAAVSKLEATACATDGADAEDCVSILGDPAANAPVPAPPSSDKVAWELWNLTPLHGGSTLLGEVGKYVAVSPARFKLVDSSAGNGLVISLAGAPAENVTVAWIMRSDGLLGTVRRSTFTLGGDGTLTVLLPR